MLFPSLSRHEYLKRAAFIGIGLVVAAFCLCNVVVFKGSVLLLIASELALVVACGHVMLMALELLGAFVDVSESLLIMVASILLMLVVVPLLWRYCFLCGTSFRRRGRVHRICAFMHQPEAVSAA